MSARSLCLSAILFLTACHTADAQWQMYAQAKSTEAAGATTAATCAYTDWNTSTWTAPTSPGALYAMIMYDPISTQKQKDDATSYYNNLVYFLGLEQDAETEVIRLLGAANNHMTIGTDNYNASNYELSYYAYVSAYSEATDCSTQSEAVGCHRALVTCFYESLLDVPNNP